MNSELLLIVHNERPHRLLPLRNLLQVQRDIDENDAALGQLIQREKHQEKSKEDGGSSHGYLYRCGQLMDSMNSWLCVICVMMICIIFFTVKCLMFRELKVD